MEPTHAWRLHHPALARRLHPFTDALNARPIDFTLEARGSVFDRPQIAAGDRPPIDSIRDRSRV